MSAPLAFVDIETTGLDADRHEPWEVAVIVRTDGGPDREYVWQLPVALENADPMALRISQFMERRWPAGIGNAGVKGDPKPDVKRVVVHPSAMAKWAYQFAELTMGCHLVGAVVSFDEERLRRLLQRHGACHLWHYHLVDVEALAVGFLAGQNDAAGMPPPVDAIPPWKSADLTALLNVETDYVDKHTALGDARWARDIYDAVMGVASATADGARS